MKPRATCPGCGSDWLSEPFCLPRQPVVLNYRFRDAAAARRVPRRQVRLAQCRRCGLVFNTTFDVSVIPYDGNYENRQCFSPAFTAHVEKLARDLTVRHRLRGGRILEVGCGKGDFLRLLCRVAAARGEGYDTTFNPRQEPEAPGVSFHRRYVGAPDITAPFDAVICRHVIEHVPAVGEFLDELRALSAACGDPVVVLETPRFEWIVEQLSLWDIFYEHCNYFTGRTLAHLCGRAGFKVVGHRAVFGGQYQVLELRLAARRLPPAGRKGRRLRAPPPPVARARPRAVGLPAAVRLGAFARRARRYLASLARQFERAGASGGWAVWGAGAKGVALVNQLEGVRPRCAVDSNPAKQGGVVPGTRIPIVGPDDPRITALALIVIANPNYGPEIRAVLARRGFAGRILIL